MGAVTAKVGTERNAFDLAYTFENDGLDQTSAQCRQMFRGTQDADQACSIVRDAFQNVGVEQRVSDLKRYFSDTFVAELLEEDRQEENMSARLAIALLLAKNSEAVPTNERVQAAYQLVRHRGVSSARALRIALGDENGEVRRAAAQILGKRQETRILMEAVKDPKAENPIRIRRSENKISIVRG
ncbi:MAG: HEAT repeat domain-containing protein [Pseudomonadota bacterium]